MTDDGLARFEALLGELPECFAALCACAPHRRTQPPAVPKRAGVYLFTEDGQARSVGRTRNFQRRLGEHTMPSSGENQAPFAFNLARDAGVRDGLTLVGSRVQVAALPEFVPYFTAAKLRVRAMEFRFVEIDDPSVSTVFEVYASLALETEGEFNLFETH